MTGKIILFWGIGSASVAIWGYFSPEEATKWLGVLSLLLALAAKATTIYRRTLGPRTLPRSKKKHVTLRRK